MYLSSKFHFFEYLFTSLGMGPAAGTCCFGLSWWGHQLDQGKKVVGQGNKAVAHRVAVSGPLRKFLGGRPFQIRPILSCSVCSEDSRKVCHIVSELKLREKISLEVVK